ncbi:putative Heat shock factor binding 1 [Rosa chinensis]|uniref:Putative Heat shock factor binding 1 n=1 Tax=Rosa chinensis TaxID=74649 RepID=A0A2P6QYB1_ROSCH|nr:putative Heat shock factor binding 1 [Rosa chinensis]
MVNRIAMGLVVLAMSRLTFRFALSVGMGNRIEELEQSINDLRAEMGVEGTPSPSAPSKPKVDTKSADDSAK